MLKQPAEFPFVGSTAYLAPLGEEVRIIQHNATGTSLIAPRRPNVPGSASDTRTVARTDLHATVEAALGRKPTKRRKAA